MGEIVTFRSTRSTPRRPVGSTGAGAEILLFTGVRYERWSESEVERMMARATPKKRLVRNRRPKKLA